MNSQMTRCSARAGQGQMQKFLNLPIICYLVPMLIGAGLYFYTYPEPIKFLAGDNVFFEIGDAIQHVTGWLSFAKDEWRWPLLKTELIAPPDGMLMIMTDSIPLAALLFKLIFSYLPENFQYFGLWHLLIYVMQATGAVFLIRSLGHRDFLAAMLASGFALLWPALMLRISHSALGMHAILLFMLGAYFRALNENWSVLKASLIFGFLALIALLIHPYLFAMCFPLVLAFAGDRLLSSGNARRQILPSLFILFGAALIVVLFAYPLGYGNIGSTSVAGNDYRHFSMNLLAPICGGYLSFCGFPDATGGQYEGFNYLGLGTLLLVALALVWLRPSLKSILAKHLFLLLILIGLFIYSLSNSLFFGKELLFTYQLPTIVEHLTGSFRASGRFFWLVGYAILFLSLATILRHRSRAILTFLCIALGVQWADMTAIRVDTKTYLTWNRPFDYAGWKQFEGRVDKVVISPAAGCENIDSMHYLYFQYVAARLGVSVNTGYFARYFPECPTDLVAAPSFEERTLYIYLEPVAEKPLGFSPAPYFEDASCALWCGWGSVVLCLKGAKPEDWQALGAHMSTGQAALGEAAK